MGQTWVKAHAGVQPRGGSFPIPCGSLQLDHDEAFRIDVGVLSGVQSHLRVRHLATLDFGPLGAALERVRPSGRAGAPRTVTRMPRVRTLRQHGCAPPACGAIARPRRTTLRRCP